MQFVSLIPDAICSYTSLLLVIIIITTTITTTTTTTTNTTTTTTENFNVSPQPQRTTAVSAPRAVPRLVIHIVLSIGAM
jgi:hypothetical protein